MQTVKDIREQFKQKLANKEFVNGTIEIIGATFLADEPFIFGTVNNEWNERELKWYKSLSRNVNDIDEPVPEIWKRVATTDGRINSNYGWCIWSSENGAQYYNAVKKLKEDQNTRQATMIYNRPSMHTDWNKDGMKDFMCTYAHQFFIRDNKLVSQYIMRSQDAVYGYKGDYNWAKYVHDSVAADLKIPSGDIVWAASSLHVYERHYNLVK